MLQGASRDLQKTILNPFGPKPRKALSPLLQLRAQGRLVVVALLEGAVVVTGVAVPAVLLCQAWRLL